MQNAQRKISYTPVTDSLSEEGVLIDNELDIPYQSLRVFSKLNPVGFQKRHGYYMKQIFFIVLIWPLLGSTSLHIFCSNRLSAYFSGGKDVLYEFLNRQNFNLARLAPSSCSSVDSPIQSSKRKNACLGSR
jgi:hypothetical protein